MYYRPVQLVQETETSSTSFGASRPTTTTPRFDLCVILRNIAWTFVSLHAIEPSDDDARPRWGALIVHTGLDERRTSATRDASTLFVEVVRVQGSSFDAQVA